MLTLSFRPKGHKMARSGGTWSRTIPTLRNPDLSIAPAAPVEMTE